MKTESDDDITDEDDENESTDEELMEENTKLLFVYQGKNYYFDILFYNGSKIRK